MIPELKESASNYVVLGTELTKIMDKEGNTYLHVMCEQGDEANIRNLVLSNMTVDWEVKNKKGDTPLIEAINACKQVVVELILGAGAKTSDCASGAWTALHAAVQTEMLPIVRSVLYSGKPSLTCFNAENI